MAVTLDEGTNHGYRTCVSLICRVCCPGLDPAGRCLTVRRKVAHTLLGLHRTAVGVVDFCRHNDSARDVRGPGEENRRQHFLMSGWSAWPAWRMLRLGAPDSSLRAEMAQQTACEMETRARYEGACFTLEPVPRQGGSHVRSALTPRQARLTRTPTGT